MKNSKGKDILMSVTSWLGGRSAQSSNNPLHRAPILRGGGGGRGVGALSTEGGRTHVTYFPEEGVFF